MSKMPCDLSYSPEVHRQLAARKWDAIVIGSGLGGLTAASLLAKAGRKVLILERHTVPGGFTHTFGRKGFVWDVGVHYVGQMEGTRSILRKIFDYVSDSKLKWSSMGELYDQAVIVGEPHDFVSDLGKQIQILCRRFPGEEKAITRYYELVQRASLSSAWYFGEKTMPLWLSRSVGWLLRRRFESFARQTTYDVLRGLTSNEQLISVLCTQCGGYGLAPKQSSFGIHAAVVEHYMRGGSYPCGGANRIHETILDVVRANDGMLVLKAEVEGIVVEGGRAVGVRMAGGEKLLAPVVISNAGVRNTLTRMLGPEQKLRVEAERALKAVQPSSAHVCLYVGLRGSDAELALPKNNLWVYDCAVTDAGPEALTYISFPSNKDPEWAAKRPGKATVQVMAACDYAKVKEWEGRPWMKRGEAYLALKKSIIDDLTEKLCVQLPQLRGRIEHVELSTPLSTRHFMNFSAGEIYGLEHSPARFKLRFLRPATKLPGLFLAGQDIVMVGLGGALFSGVLVATKVLHKSVIFRILFNLPLRGASKRLSAPAPALAPALEGPTVP